MAVERKFTCDGPECETWISTHADQPPTFLTVRENPGFAHEPGAENHFCSWDCALKFGARFEPTTVIPMDDSEER